MANDKIRDDEIMSDDELDNVAGGRMYETFNDIKTAHSHGLIQIDPSTNSSIEEICAGNCDKLPSMFKKFGITFTYNEGKGNDYVYEGVFHGERFRRHISQSEAWQMVLQKLYK